MRTILSKTIENPDDFRMKALLWSRHFREAVVLDSNGYGQKYSSFDFAIAVDALTSIQTDAHHAFDDLEEYRKTTKDWIFGFLSYDLKNDVETLTSANFDGLAFPDLYFFQPKKLLFLRGNALEFHYLRMCDDEIKDDLLSIYAEHPLEPASKHLSVLPRISKESYLQKIGMMKDHLKRGDIYEANFCMEYYCDDALIDPVETFIQLNRISLPPFATFLRLADKYLMCASPERFSRKEGRKVISQPIKGTAKRSLDPTLDEQSKQSLLNSEKERSENIMIVDLVRNDLSKIAARGTVEVEELCGAYTFSQVHHLISTVACNVREEISPVEVIKSAFPMGSMTGAPKISAMKIIESLEETRRGLYSGCVGYFTPDGDFDFNVVIRSILYDKSSRYVSFSVGSAITDKSDPEQEYAECLVKAEAMQTVLKN